MTKKLLSFLLLCLSFSAMANAQTLVLHHANGKTTDVQLYTMPRVTFQDDKVLITSSVLDMEYPKEDIIRFTYKGSAVGINKATGKANFTEENNELVFHNVKSTEKIFIYRTNGIRVPVRIIRQGDSATLPLNALSKGVYLLSVNGRTSKFTKR